LLSGGGSEPSLIDQNALTLWDLQTGARLVSFAGHDWPIDAIAVSDEGQDVILAANDAFEIWDLPSRSLRHSVTGHGMRTHALASVPGHRLAVSAGGDGLVMLWDLATGQRLRTLRGHHATVIDVAVTPDARFAISASWDQTLKIWDLESARQTERVLGHTAEVQALAATPDQRYAISASHDHSLLVWSLSSFAPVRKLLGHSHWVRALALTSDGHRALSASWDGTLRLWDLETAKQLMSFHLMTEDEHFEVVALAPDGHHAIAGAYSGSVALWDLNRPAEPPAIFKASEKSISSLDLLLDGGQAIVASDDGSLKIWDLEHGALLKTLDPGPPPLPSSGDEAADLLDERRIGRPHWTTVRVLPGGRRALTASSRGNLALWDLETGTQESTWQACSVGITGLAVTPDGRFAAATSGTPHYASDNTLRIWNLETREFVARFVGESPFLSCALCRDGATLLAGMRQEASTS
jgi:WD40 repeat protein